MCDCSVGTDLMMSAVYYVKLFYEWKGGWEFQTKCKTKGSYGLISTVCVMSFCAESKMTTATTLYNMPPEQLWKKKKKQPKKENTDMIQDFSSLGIVLVQLQWDFERHMIFTAAYSGSNTAQCCTAPLTQWQDTRQQGLSYDCPTCVKKQTENNRRLRKKNETRKHLTAYINGSLNVNNKSGAVINHLTILWPVLKTCN